MSAATGTGGRLVDGGRMPNQPQRDSILTREIMPNETAGGDGYDLSVSANLIEQNVSVDTDILKELEDIPAESANVTEIGAMKDADRQIFEEDYKAAVEATGITTMVIPEFIRDIAEDLHASFDVPDTVELPVSQDPTVTMATAPEIKETVISKPEPAVDEDEIFEPESKAS